MRLISWARKPVSALPLLVLAVLVVVGVVAATGSAAAPQSPAGCNADNSVVNIARSQFAAVAGETVTFTVSSGNPTTADGCDITGRSIMLTLPNGTSQVFGPFNEPNGTPITVRGQLPYVVTVADLVTVRGVEVWPAIATWTGTQLDGFDSASTGYEGDGADPGVAGDDVDGGCEQRDDGACGCCGDGDGDGDELGRGGVARRDRDGGAVWVVDAGGCVRRQPPDPWLAGLQLPGDGGCGGDGHGLVC